MAEFISFGVKILIQCFCRSLLYLLGWEYRVDQRLLENKKRVVAIYPHSSKWDYFLSIIYLLSHPDIFERSYYIIKPQLFEGLFGKFFSYFNGLPSSKMECHGLGTVERISKILNDKDRFIFLISPEGMLKFNEWRSGYFAIAKKTNSVIVVLGLDYEQRMIKIISASNVIDDTSDQESLQKQFQIEMSNIVPLFPECCITSAGITGLKPSAVDYYRLSLFAGIFFLFREYKLYLLLFLMVVVNLNQILVYDLFID